MSSCSLTGAIPSEWGNSSFPNLISFNLQSNLLVGVFPAQEWNFITMPKLTTYVLSNTSVLNSWAWGCTPLPYPTSNYYYSSPCRGNNVNKAGSVILNQATVQPCTDTPVLDGYYVASLCTSGNYSIAGNDRVVKPCATSHSLATFGQYVSSICSTGDSYTLGSDINLSYCNTSIPITGTLTMYRMYT